MRSDLIDISGVLHHQTDAAILFSETGEEGEAVWLPKSVVEVEAIDPKRPDYVTVTLPERWARDKGLI